MINERRGREGEERENITKLQFKMNWARGGVGGVEKKGKEKNNGEVR